MNWLNLELTTLRSERFLGSEPVERATWLCLMAYCADQENGGVFESCGEWGDRKWMQLVGVTAKEVRAPSDLWSWDGHTLIVWGYPEKKQAEVQRLRDQARNAAAKRWGNAKPMPQGMPCGIQKGNGVGNAKVEVEVEVEGNKKKDTPNKSAVNVSSAPSKQTKRQKHDAAVFACALPSAFDTIEFAEVWQAFCDHRADAGKWLTERAIKALFSKLEGVSEPDARDALTTSIMSGWSGVFPKPSTHNSEPKEREYGL